MNSRLILAVGALLLAATARPATDNMTERRAVRSTNLPRPRDGNVAVQEELDTARRAGTIEAYDLFLARNPRHPLAEIARRERARLPAPRR